MSLMPRQLGWWVPVGLILLLGGAALWWAVKLLPHSRTNARFASTSTTLGPGPRPNVLLISLDTLRPDHLGCYGYDKATTPNLDRLAGESLLFTNCRAQAPWTLPSHMSLFTSMLPTFNGVDNINNVLPAEIPTLAQLLREEGYRTVALVNNGQMRAHWGFGRGFETWREFEADTPQGNCENITSQALGWLKENSADKPFFLFLHYYDTHDPYEAPEPYRQRMGTTLTGAQARQVCRRHRSPEQKLRNPALLADLIAAYDAEVAWLDHEVGRLLQDVPPETVVIVLSDHGEAFAEHGWLLHGATLYDEEIRTPLIVRRPGDRPEGKRCDDAVMLMDVAPTVLKLCGVRAPVQFQGADLGPLWQDGKLKERLIFSETKAVLEGRYLLSVTVHPLKGIYSLFDGRFELYKLPDEQKVLTGSDPAAAEALLKPLREWINGEQYWMLHATGKGDFEATIECVEGSFALFIPVGLDRMRDGFEVMAEGRALSWHVYPDGGVKSLFLQPARPDAALRVDFKINGTGATQTIFLGKDRLHPEALPATIAADIAPLSPFIERPFAADKEGFYVFRHRTPGARARPAQVQQLDEQTIRQLRSLGYLQ